MNKNMNLPAEYAVLSEEEMTYTQGGSDIGGFVTTAATVVGAVVRAADAVCEDMSKSAANFVLDAVSSTMVVALAPLSAVLLIL